MTKSLSARHPNFSASTQALTSIDVYGPSLNEELENRGIFVLELDGF